MDREMQSFDCVVDDILLEVVGGLNDLRQQMLEKTKTACGKGPAGRKPNFGKNYPKNRPEKWPGKT